MNAVRLPIGVTRHRRRFRAQIKDAGTVYHLGVFDTPEEAGAAYAAAKVSEERSYGPAIAYEHDLPVCVMPLRWSVGVAACVEHAREEGK